jgi:hypothetical protein
MDQRQEAAHPRGLVSGLALHGPVFGQKDPRSVTLDEISALRAHVRDKYGVREAHRMVKIWRALWKVAALNKYCDLHLDPSKGFQNNAAEGRGMFWLEAETVALGNKAWELGYHGLAAVIAVMWDSQMSPVDIRTLRASQMASAGQGEVFFTKRTKRPTCRLAVCSARLPWCGWRTTCKSSA